MSELEKLKKRREAAAYQRKTTTQLWTAMEYDNEIAAIDQRILELTTNLKNGN